MQISFINDEISSNIDEALAFARKNKLRYIELRRIDGKDITELTPAEACALAEKITCHAAHAQKERQRVFSADFIDKPCRAEIAWQLSKCD